MKFRKKPVVIEAMQLTEHNVKVIYEWVFGKIYLDQSRQREKWNEYVAIVRKNGMNIPTLEDGLDKRAKHVASLGDWVIKGVKGEFYPCKPDIFEMTYEAVGEHK